MVQVTPGPPCTRYDSIMSLGEIVNTAFIAFISAGVGALLWTRLGRLEDQLVTKASVADLNSFRSESRAELNSFRAEVRAALAATASAADLNSFRAEVRAELAEVRRQSREEFAGLRSDLTHMALAVGAGRPQASEG